MDISPIFPLTNVSEILCQDLTGILWYVMIVLSVLSNSLYHVALLFFKVSKGDVGVSLLFLLIHVYLKYALVFLVFLAWYL